MLPSKGFFSTLVVLVMFALFILSCAGPKVPVKPPEEEEVEIPERPIQPLKEAPVVRILLVGPTRRVGVSVNGSFFLGRGFKDESLTRLDKGGKFFVSVSGSVLKFSAGRKVLLKGGEIVVMPYGDNRIYIMLVFPRYHLSIDFSLPAKTFFNSFTALPFLRA